MQKLSDYETELWTGEIEYHTFKASNWYQVGGFKHPLIQILCERIQRDPLIAQVSYDYKIYIIGGILEDWITGDIDFAVIGKYRALAIKIILERIVELGFRYHIYADVHYQEKLWRVDEWSKGEIEGETIQCYSLSNYFVKNGVRLNCNHYKEVDGLFTYPLNYPFKKHIVKRDEGYIYNAPIRIL